MPFIIKILQYKIDTSSGEQLTMTYNTIVTHPSYSQELLDAISRHEEKLSQRKRKAESHVGEPPAKAQKVVSNPDEELRQQSTQLVDYPTNEMADNGVPMTFLTELTSNNNHQIEK